MSINIQNDRDEHDNAIVRTLQRSLTDAGIRGALEWLNQRTAYRFTALNIKYGDDVRNVYVFDRLDPGTKPFINAPVYKSFCGLVFASRQPVVIANAATVNANEPAPLIKSYCGVPLSRMDGSVFGTVCHFDTEPRQPEVAEMAVLSTASRLLSADLNELSQ